MKIIYVYLLFLVELYHKVGLVPHPTTTMAAPCYMKCIFLELDVINTSNGEVHYEKMMYMIPENMKRIAYNMGKNCIHFKGEGGSDLCQVSYDIHKCWQQADPEHYFLMK